MDGIAEADTTDCDCGTALEALRDLENTILLTCVSDRVMSKRDMVPATMSMATHALRFAHCTPSSLNHRE
jgi:hypothetical protein